MRSGRSQQPAHFVAGEDVGQEDRFLDRRQRVLGHVARRIAPAAEQAQLADHPELVAQRNRLAPGDARAPPCYGLFERRLAMLSPAIGDEAHETLEDELGSPSGRPQCCTILAIQS